MKWQDLTVVNRDGLKLAGLLRAAAPADDGSRAAAPCLDPARSPLVIVCHGFTGGKEGGGGARAMADQLARLGFSTLLFDFSGSGESEGLPEEVTLSRQVDDLGAVVDWARAQGYRQIILNGRSFGGTTVLAYAASDRSIAAVCTWAAVALPLVLFDGFCRQKPALDGPAADRVTLSSDGGSICLQRQFFQDLQRYDLSQCAARIAPRPLLLIHGTADRDVPYSDAKLLFDAAAEPKKLVLIAEADHVFSDHRAEVWDYFFRWLRPLQSLSF